MSSEDSLVAATAEVVMEDSPPPQRAVGAKSVKSPSGTVRGKQSHEKVGAPQTFSFLWPGATVPKTSHEHGRLLTRAPAPLPSPQGQAQRLRDVVVPGSGMQNRPTTKVA